MDKFELMALMMGGGGSAPAQDAAAEMDEQEALAYYAEDDLAVQLGMAKPGAAVLLGTAVASRYAGTHTAPPKVVVGTNVFTNALRKEFFKPSLKSAVKALRKAEAHCRYCGAVDLVWLMQESGRWRLYDAEGHLHECNEGKQLPFRPLIQPDDE